MNIAQFLASGALKDVRRSRAGYLARCPAHDDHEPSLSISEGAGGRILLHCWAGCATEVVLAKLGLSWADCFPASPPRRRRSSRR
jgi:putative DNA primase/helicase